MKPLAFQDLCDIYSAPSFTESLDKRSARAKVAQQFSRQTYSIARAAQSTTTTASRESFGIRASRRTLNTKALIAKASGLFALER
jgi:hypothetical protein